MVTIITDEHGNPIGWKMEPKTKEEQEIAGIIRDLQFFGFNETHPEYAGMELIDENKGKVPGNLKSISWVQEKHIKH